MSLRFFVFPEGFLTLACLLVNVNLLKRKRMYRRGQ
jgi:hypothetical protein